MLKSLLVLFFTITSLSIFAQDFAQSQSTPLDWETIENDFVQVIYPKGFNDDAIYMANLIEHYSHFVGLTYNIKRPKKITLIFRPELAQPNGFVTLAPRRTEWFDSSNFFVHTGTLEWKEILSIHEYRHVIQLDAFNKNTVGFVDILFGDFGRQVLDFLARKSWYMEGDAVYTETKYTEAGRGRSARFLARLKAIILGGETPSYDQFVSGSYNDQLVSQYLYGYILISYGYKTYGDDFWNVVNENISRRPYPNGIVGAIENASGVDFYDFYYAAFDDLRKKWAKDRFSEMKKEDYRVKTNPHKTGKDLYYINYDLNSHYTLYKNDEELTELPYREDLNRVDYSDKHVVFNQFLPHWRYGFKGYSDLSLIDLEDGSKSFITSGERLYNPRFNKDGSKIIAISFDDKNDWVLKELNLKGETLRTIKRAGYEFLEAVYLSNNEAAAIITQESGRKAIAKVNLNTGNIQTIVPLTWNNLYWVKSDFRKSIVFEAQHQGKVEVFKLNMISNKLEKCTSSRIAAFTPEFAGSEIIYSEETINGKRIQTIPQSACRPVAIDSLVSKNKWQTSSDPSDNYLSYKNPNFKDREKMRTKNASSYKVKDYSGFDWRAFTPHSWNFFVGSGYGLSLTSDNYLRDFGWNLSLGYEAVANSSYSNVKIDFKRYWPVLSILADLRDREVSRLGTDDDDYDWTESSYGLQVELPFLKRRNLYSIIANISYSAEQVITDDYQDNELDITGEADFIRQTTAFNFAVQKDLTARSIISPWSFGLSGIYQDADTDDTTGLAGDYRLFGEAQVTVPGLFKNTGLKLILTAEEYGDGSGYRFQPAANEILGYTLSRGYNYFATKKYYKTSTNYLFPLIYPDYNLKALIYFKRVYVNLFYDNTKVYTLNNSDDLHLSSYGSEIIFNTVILRALPVDFGIRYSYKHEEEKAESELFLGTSLVF